MSSAQSDDSEHSWVLDLENSLMEECSAADIYCICKGKSLPSSLRSETWKICLDLKDRDNQISKFNEIYDLPNQSTVRDDCKRLIKQLHANDPDMVTEEVEDNNNVELVADLEAIVTFYCKSRNFPYTSDNGWLQLLLPLVSLKASRSTVYNLFEAIRDTYIVPTGWNSSVFHIFRLLLLYHEPELCSFLDTKKIPPQSYCQRWFQTLFTATCHLDVITNMWDYYFQQSDPFFIFYLALIMVVNAKEHVLAMREEARDYIIEQLAKMPCNLQADDVEDFCSLAQYYACQTPATIRTDHFVQQPDDDDDEVRPWSTTIGQSLCLPVSVAELLDSSGSSALRATSRDADTVRFFLVDCRPVEQYNAGHLPNAFHLDCDLMLQEPAAFATAVQGLLSSQRQALAHNSDAGGEHLCFLGSGRNEEDQYTHMIIASFLQRRTQYVSMVQGGYIAVHDYYADNVDAALDDHCADKCIACVNCRSSTHQPSSKSPPTGATNANTTANTSNSTGDLFGRITAAMKSKSAEMKGKLLDYIVHPTAAQQPQNSKQHGGSSNVAANIVGATSNATHTSAAASVEHDARPAVFSIDDEHDVSGGGAAGDLIAETPPSGSADGRQQVSVQSWLKRSDVIEVFDCQEVKLNGCMYSGHLLVTEGEIVVLRDVPKKRGQAVVAVKRQLASIVKITARKKNPQLITFKYGHSNGDQLSISDMDRFLIPNAARATKVISEQILSSMHNKSQ